MTILRSCIFALVALFFAGLLPVVAQEANDQGSAAKGSSSQQIEQANEALVKVLNDPESRAAFLELLQKSTAASGAGGTGAGAAPQDANSPAAVPEDASMQENPHSGSVSIPGSWSTIRATCSNRRCGP